MWAQQSVADFCTITYGNARSVIVEHRLLRERYWIKQELPSNCGLPLPGTSPTRNWGSAHWVFNAYWDWAVSRQPGQCCTNSERQWFDQIARSWLEKSRLMKHMSEVPAKEVNEAVERKRNLSWLLPSSFMNRKDLAESECVTYLMLLQPASFPLFATLLKQARLSEQTHTMPTTLYPRKDISIIDSICRAATTRRTYRCRQSILLPACSSAGFWEPIRVPSMVHICRPIWMNIRSALIDATRADVVCFSTAYFNKLWSQLPEPYRKIVGEITNYNTFLGTAKWSQSYNLSGLVTDVRLGTTLGLAIIFF